MWLYAVGLPNDQVLHHFLTKSPWEVDPFGHAEIVPDFATATKTLHRPGD